LDATVQLERLIFSKRHKAFRIDFFFFKTAVGRGVSKKKEVVGGGDWSDASSSKRS